MKVTTLEMYRDFLKKILLNAEEICDIGKDRNDDADIYGMRGRALRIYNKADAMLNWIEDDIKDLEEDE